MPHVTTFNPPKPRCQKGARGKPDRAYVTVRGQRVYLGTWKSPESKVAHDRLVAELRASHGTLPVRPEDITVAEVAAAFLRRCEVHYRRPDGRPTSEVVNIKLALRPIVALYGDTLARDFGPRSLKACRQWVVDQGGARSYANKQTGRIRRMFRWAVEEEMVDPSVMMALGAVAGLQRGRTAARETEPVRPVPAAWIRAVRPYVSRQVWAMIELQRLTGMRPGEVVIMRASDLETDGKVWTYRPADHKMSYRGHDRKIPIGPRAQVIVGGFLRAQQLDAYLFSPRDAERERRDRCPTHRHQPVARALTPRRLGERYTVNSYRRAITYATEAAGVTAWSPGRLRHNAATRLRREFGIDLAQTILGHRLGSAITEIYAEANTKRAWEVMGKVG